MVAAGARLVTSRGLVPVEEVLTGDEVLTHRASFAKVMTVLWDVVTDEPMYRLGRGPLCAASTRAYAVQGGWFQSETNYWPVVSEVVEDQKLRVHTITAAEWANSDWYSRRKDMAKARGVTINASPGAVVLGVSPSHIFGSILFASRLEGREYLDVTRERFTGRVYSILVEGPDGSFVADRTCLR